MYSSLRRESYVRNFMCLTKKEERYEEKLFVACWL